MKSAGHIAGLAAAFAACLALSSAPASAQDNTWGFTMPSGNIVCDLTPGEGGFQSHVRCDFKQMPDNPPRPPADCSANWGDAFQVETNSTVGVRVCHAAGDQSGIPAGPVLAYGSTWKGEGFTCTAQTSGVTCANGLGHGFTISRETQRLF